MKVDRKRIYIGKIPKKDNGFAEISPAQRVSFMWELTAELWSLKGAEYVERRLQRNVTNLIKK